MFDLGAVAALIHMMLGLQVVHRVENEQVERQVVRHGLFSPDKSNGKVSSKSCFCNLDKFFEI